MFKFYAVPAWQLIEGKKSDAAQAEQPLVPATMEPGIIEAALARVEYRGFKARERALQLLSEKSPAVFANSPNDLPALLRTADQLLTAAKVDAGQRARVWRCQCGARYAVPVTLVSPVSLPCERCGATVELDPVRATGEANVTDARTDSVNAARHSLSEFFREAMARGWPVLVAKS